MERKACGGCLVEDSATLLTTVKQQLKPDWNHPRASRRGCENLAEVSAEVGDWPPQTVIVSWCTSFAENLPGWLLDMDVNTFHHASTPGKPCLCEQVCMGHFGMPQVEKVLSFLSRRTPS